MCVARCGGGGCRGGGLEEGKTQEEMALGRRFSTGSENNTPLFPLPT